jgi:DNA repair exonuclease SbcCD ATPase subunit
MGKALKPLVIIVLLLSGTALGLGIVLFNQREVIKGRTQRLEAAVDSIARSIHYDELDQEALKSYDTMQSVLAPLNAFAGNMYIELQDTIQDLANTKLDLEATREELRITQNKLTAAEQQVAHLNDRLEESRQQLAQANQTINQLERDKVALQGSIEDLELRIAEVEDEKLELQDELLDSRDFITQLEDEIKELTGDTTEVPDDLMGKIMVVNPEWNFVVLDIGRDSGLGVNVEMLIKREDQLVGKVRISALDKDVAVAEILKEWEQSPVKEGDHVIVL